MKTKVNTSKPITQLKSQNIIYLKVLLYPTLTPIYLPPLSFSFLQ